MSFTVNRRGGVFNPRAMCFTPNERFLLVGCGPLINIYEETDGRDYWKLFKQVAVHKADVTSIVCWTWGIVSADSDGVIHFHKYNELSVIEWEPEKTFQNPEGIEKLLVRNDTLFYIFYRQKMYWFVEFGVDVKRSQFGIDNALQTQLCNLHPSLELKEKSWLRFPTLDAFDIDDSKDLIVIGDECKLHIYDFRTHKRTDHNLQEPARICMFRGFDALVYTRNGTCKQYGTSNFHDHWHFSCPNAVVFDSVKIYSGGSEGTIQVTDHGSKRRSPIPRLGMTIEGLALSSRSKWLSAIVDKNILVIIANENQSLRRFYSHIYGDILSFNKEEVVALRKPNLVQYFNTKTGNLAEQLQVSTYNTRVPVTAFDVTDDFLVTVEISGGNEAPRLTIRQQCEFNHKAPHANSNVAKETKQNMLTRPKFDEKRQLMKIKYKSKKDGAEDDGDDENEEVSEKAREGNPLIHDKGASDNVCYSEVKIWHRGVDSETQAPVTNLEQSFRIIGRSIYDVALHPKFPMFTLSVGKEAQIWKLNGDKWDLWSSCVLSEVPEKLIWSPDGSIIIAQYTNRLEFLDAESLEVAARKVFEHDIKSTSFMSDYEIVVHLLVGVAIFDLRSLSIVKMLYVEPEQVAAHNGCIALVQNGRESEDDEHPTVFLYRDGKMEAWSLPTNANGRAIHINNAKGITITVIDNDDVIWSVDEYGTIEIEEARVKTITRNRPQEFVPRVIVSQEDKTKQMLEVLDVPSHQIPSIRDLCAEFYQFVLEENPEVQATTIIEKPIDIREDDDEVTAVQLRPQDVNMLRQMF